jgi:hypothetical protein
MRDCMQYKNLLLAIFIIIMILGSGIANAQNLALHRNQLNRRAFTLDGKTYKEFGPGWLYYRVLFNDDIKGLRYINSAREYQTFSTVMFFPGIAGIIWGVTNAVREKDNIVAPIAVGVGCIGVSILTDRLASIKLQKSADYYNKNCKRIKYSPPDLPAKISFHVSPNWAGLILSF